jgi:hypothetical protein
MPPLPPPEQSKTKVTVTSDGEEPQDKEVAKQGMNHRAVISSRIDSAVKLYPKAGADSSAGGAAENSVDIDSSADLIQLQKEFQEFRKKLKELVIVANQYPGTLESADKARVNHRQVETTRDSISHGKHRRPWK